MTKSSKLYPSTKIPWWKLNLDSSEIQLMKQWSWLIQPLRLLLVSKIIELLESHCWQCLWILLILQVDHCYFPYQLSTNAWKNCLTPIPMICWRHRNLLNIWKNGFQAQLLNIGNLMSSNYPIWTISRLSGSLVGKISSWDNSKKVLVLLIYQKKDPA